MPEIIPEAAVPGTIVAAGVLISPSGDQGPIGQTGSQGIQGIQGVNSYTVTTADFDLPAVNLTVSVTVQDASWVVPGQMVVVAGGYSLRVTGKTGNTLTLQNIGSPATAIPIVSPSGNGLMRMLPNTGQAYFRDDGSYVVLPGNYYGSDTTNSGAYAVTVASDFLLNPGVVVWVTVSNQCAANPTLNVNGTGAVSLRNRMNLVLNQYEIRPGTFGATYDGAVWRIFTPLVRGIANTSVSGTYTVPCAGFDAVNVYGGLTAATTLLLTNLGFGVPVTLRLYASVAVTYMIQITTPVGATPPVYWAWSNAIGGASLVRIDNAAQSMAAGNQMFMTGCLEFAGTAMFL
jgi:hypothetical protein